VRDLNGIKRFYYGSGFISRKEFQSFVNPLLDNKAFQAIEWLPRVPLEKRNELETAAKKDGLKNFDLRKLTELEK